MTDFSGLAAAVSATRTEAGAQLDGLVANPEFRSKLLAGGAAETRQFHELIAAKSGGENKLDKIIAGTAEVPWLETTANGELSSYKIASTVADLRERGLDDATIKQAITNAPVSEAERDAAKELRAVRLSDKAWTAKWLAGDRAAQKEMTLLNIIISGGGSE